MTDCLPWPEEFVSSIRHDRATIALPSQSADRTVATTYLHFDDLPAHAGETLKQYFSMQSQAEELVAGGERRCVDRESGTAERYSTSGAPEILPTYDALIEFVRNGRAKFVYVFDDGVWSCKVMSQRSLDAVEWRYHNGDT